MNSRDTEMSAWQKWLQHPQGLRLRKAFSELHLWMGVGIGLYVSLLSISGSVIVFRSELDRTFFYAMVEWLVNFHSNLLFGPAGRFVNGLGSVCVTLVCLTGIIVWWPGISHWRRALTVDWKAHFARFNWDMHSALGFWSLFLVLLWAISGFYFAFPEAVNAVFRMFGSGGDAATLYWLAFLHFGRFNLFTKSIWAVCGLVPAVLSATGVFLCCHRIIHGIRENHEPD
jgi:uncharacterized iron-regulated membrane protein